MPCKAGIQAQINNRDPGVPTHIEVGQRKANTREQKQGANILLLRKAAGSPGDFKINFLISLSGEKSNMQIRGPKLVARLFPVMLA